MEERKGSRGEVPGREIASILAVGAGSSADGRRFAPAGQVVDIETHLGATSIPSALESLPHSRHAWGATLKPDQLVGLLSLTVARTAIQTLIPQGFSRLRLSRRLESESSTNALIAPISTPTLVDRALTGQRAGKEPQLA